MSHDIEDVVAVLDGRPEITEEIAGTDSQLKQELARRFDGLLGDRNFIDAVSGHMPTDEISQARVKTVINTIKNISLR